MQILVRNANDEDIRDIDWAGYFRLRQSTSGADRGRKKHSCLL
jgi:hypothetical protein